MANPYLRFMNGDMPFWDFVSEMGGQEYAQQYGGHGDEHGGRRGGRHDRRHRGPPGPPGPHGPPPPPPGFDPHGPPPPGFPFGGFGGFGSWSPFDGPAPEGPWGHGPGHHDFPHRPHPRHRHGGRHGPPRDGPAPPEHPPSGDEDMDTPPATPHARAGDDAATLMSDDTITLQDNEKNDKEKDVEVPDPDISTPDGDDKARDGNNDKDDGSGSDSDSDHHRRRGCPWGRRRGPHGHGPHGPGAHWGGPRRGRGGFGGWPGRHHPHHPYGHGGPWARHGPHPPFGGPGRHGPPPHHRRGPSGEDNDPFNGGSGFDDLMRAFAADPRLSGIGDMIGNVLRATGAALNPDAARDGVARQQPAGDDANDNNPDVDFRPSADIYDTTDAFLVHVVVPGAEKENVSVSWDGNTQELRVAGFVAREGDEETLQALALAERDVGVFERSLKLGTDKVEEDGITAKMTNGILEITVPKKKEEDTWTEVRSVDIL